MNRLLFYPLLPLFIAWIIPVFSSAQSTPIPVILDADTGNEVDDLYAVARALIEPSWKILALNATHWQTSHWTIPQSMENSHRLNQVLAGELDVNVRTRRGGVARMFDWGDQAQHSAAAYEIIQQAERMPNGQKLTVIALGALTNVASAIYIEPSIASKLKLYWLGTTYDFERNMLKKQDFNCVMDIQAVETLLQSSVEWHIMPVSVAYKMAFSRKECEEKFNRNHTIHQLLIDRWTQHLDGSRRERVIWDLALIEAILHPEWATEVKITTSRDNGQRSIYYYQDIRAEPMKAEFFEKLNTLEN